MPHSNAYSDAEFPTKIDLNLINTFTERKNKEHRNDAVSDERENEKLNRIFEASNRVRLSFSLLSNKQIIRLHTQIWIYFFVSNNVWNWKEHNWITNGHKWNWRCWEIMLCVCMCARSCREKKVADDESKKKYNGRYQFCMKFNWNERISVQIMWNKMPREIGRGAKNWERMSNT